MSIYELNIEGPLVAEITYYMLYNYDFWVLSTTITKINWQLLMEGPMKNTN